MSARDKLINLLDMYAPAKREEAINGYRDEVLREAADCIRGTFAIYSGTNLAIDAIDAADLIDPDKP